MNAARQADQQNKAGQAKDARDKAAKSLEQAAKGAKAAPLARSVVSQAGSAERAGAEERVDQERAGPVVRRLP